MLVGQPLNPDDELTLFIRDALCFISMFMVPIEQSAPHVYLSALPFAPEKSHVARKFCLRFPNTFVVTEGKPNQWPMVVFTTEHQKYPVNEIAFSPDESTFSYQPGHRYSSSGDTTYICDSETGRCILGPFHDTHSACFSPSGKHILFKYRSYAVVWDIEMGEEQFRIKGSDFAFVHHDGRIVSTKKLGDQGENRILVQFWDASNGESISSRPLEVNDVRFAEFSPDGHFLFVTKESEDVAELWNLEDSKDFRRFTRPRYYLSCFSPDGHFLAIKKDNVIELWNLEDRKYFRRFTYPHETMNYLRFSPSSDMLMVASWNGRCQTYIWRSDTQEMTSFSRRLHDPHVIRNYLFGHQDHTVEIWDVSATGSKRIRETRPASTSRVRRICPSSDGHRVLAGYKDGSVRMWDVDLENLAISQADITDTRDNTDERQVIRISPSGKMAVTISKQSSNVGFLDTTTGKVLARTDIWACKINTHIAFSPNEDQVAFIDSSLTICDIAHPKKRVSVDFLPEEDDPWGKVAFQTCNDLVICAIFYDGSDACGDSDGESEVLQVWHRQDPTGFECTYSLDVGKDPRAILAPDGLTVIIVPFYSSYPSSAKCYS